MPQHIRHRKYSKYVWGPIIALGSMVVALVVAVLGSRSVNNAPTTSTRPRPTPMTSVSIVISPTATRTLASDPTQLIPVLVRAYTIEGRMADGKWTYLGACAVSTGQFPLGTILYLYNADGSFNRQCLAEDTGGDIAYGQVDLAMPGDTAGATRWGIRHLFARVMRWGWDGGGSPTALPIPMEQQTGSAKLGNSSLYTR
jgi:3D (Asp-Asp-Asp) domain-containing protein